MIVNLLATEQERDLQKRNFVNVRNAIGKLTCVIAAVSLVGCQAFRSDSDTSKSLLVRGDTSVFALDWGTFGGLKTRPSISIHEISNIQTSIKYRIAPRICKDQDGNEYYCP